jgi:hypothetical protein
MAEGIGLHAEFDDGIGPPVNSQLLQVANGSSALTPSTKCGEVV